MTRSTLVMRYLAFAVMATVANLATQRFILRFGDADLYFAAAVGGGTIVGLIVKYFLDKRWIFCDFETGIKSHSRKFSLYAVMGLVTTAIFWGAETVFWFLWRTDFMRELGALLGLGIGYVIKYNLDRRFVFTDATLGKAA
jgi:putative flippase GtrA